MSIKYYLGALLSIPLLPIMYLQGKRIRASIPKLPEAMGLMGSCRVIDKNVKSLNLMTIGESTIAGVGVATHEEGLTGTLAKELSHAMQVNASWHVYARSGYTAVNISKKLIPIIEEKNIDLIVIGLGGNDAFKLNSPRKWTRDVSAVIEQLQGKYPNTPIVFINMPPIKEFPAFTPLIKSIVGNLIELLGEALKKTVVRYENVYYFGEIITIDTWRSRYNIDPLHAEFFSDGVHPSKLTYQTWAKDIATRILSNQSIRASLELRLINKII
ncbi:MAG: lysophospholipase L1-like esterase [Flavobacteriaceae bacterium]|jgi:lysophospholipase L1-like esterase